MAEIASKWYRVDAQIVSGDGTFAEVAVGVEAMDPIVAAVRAGIKIVKTHGRATQIVSATVAERKPKVVDV